MYLELFRFKETYHWFNINYGIVFSLTIWIIRSPLNKKGYTDDLFTSHRCK
jgi:hypothetical protein